ncbi:MAG: PQQ-dependent sugar dehydrogenase [Bdellovibrionota bacterium]
MRTTVYFLLFLCLALSQVVQSETISQEKAKLPLEKIKLPKNFEISVFAVVPGARSLAISPDGTIFVGSGGLSGSVKKVYSVRDTNGDNKADVVKVLADGLNSPNGVAYRDGNLYIGEIHQIQVIKNVDKFVKDVKAVARPEKIGPSFPKDKHHGWKFIRFDQNGNLYVPVGAPCNVCKTDPGYATIFKVDLKSNKKEIVAEGVRNTVGFDFHPATNELWFTDNGRDWMGDNIPPCELNRLEKEKSHFGFPHCHGKHIEDPEFKNKLGCLSYAPPVLELGAHVAPLGMRFYIGKQFSEEYRNQIFIAEHGSWNRSQPQGYKVGLAKLDGNKVISYTTFAEGWLSGKDYWGRPVDVEIYTDGSLLVSDDYAGVIYRISQKR